MDRITKAFLEAEPKACEDQVAIFCAEWPDGMDITEENILRCIQLSLDVDWFMSEKAGAPAWAEYYKAMAPAWEEYYKTKTTAPAPAWEEYYKAMAPARAEEYDKATASAVVRILKAVGE